MRAVTYICGTVIALAVGVIAWKWQDTRDSNLPLETKEDVNAALTKGVTLLAFSRFDRSVQVFEHILRRNTANPFALNNLAVARAEQREFQQAETLLLHALQSVREESRGGVGAMCWMSNKFFLQAYLPSDADTRQIDTRHTGESPTDFGASSFVLNIPSNAPLVREIEGNLRMLRRSLQSQ